MKPDLLMQRSPLTTFKPNKHWQSTMSNRSNSNKQPYWRYLKQLKLQKLFQDYYIDICEFSHPFDYLPIVIKG